MPLSAALTLAREDAMLGLYDRARRAYEDKIIPEIRTQVKLTMDSLEFSSGDARVQFKYELERWKETLDKIEGECEAVASLSRSIKSLGEAIVQGTAVSRATTPKPCMGKKL